MAEHPDDRNPLHQQKTTIASYCSVLAAIVRIQTAGRKMQNLISALSMILPDDGTVAVLMGGGAGTRLFPLTKERAKPAVPLGGRYRFRLRAYPV
jgi:nucleotidyltransferase-like protein